MQPSSGLRIYAEQAVGPSRPPRPPSPVAVTPRPAVPARALGRQLIAVVAPVSQDEASACDARLLAVLDRAPDPGDTVDISFRSKERELAGEFAALPVMAARALHRRLASPQPNDVLATRFGQLITERRGRLLAILADVRRREAIAMARGK